MSKDKRFDAEILEQATKAADALLEHPEVRGVAVVIDWSLPSAASHALPVGVIRTAGEESYIQHCSALNVQVTKMSGSISHNIMENIRSGYAKLKEAQTTEKPVST